MVWWARLLGLTPDSAGHTRWLRLRHPIRARRADRAREARP